VSVAVTAGQTMSQVATAINATNGGVQASVVNGLLRLTSRETGASSAITASSPDGVDLGLGDLVSGQDAKGTIDGQAFSSASNTLSSIPGLTLNLLSTTTSGNEAQITVDPTRVDKDGIKGKIRDFVTAYNDVVQAITDKVTEKSVQNPTTDDDRAKGMLFGDTTLTSLLDNLRSAFQQPVGGLASGQNLAAYAGLSTGAVGGTYSADVAAGKLTFDESKLDALLANGTGALKQLFSANGATNDVDGVMQRVSDITWGATKFQGTLAYAIDIQTQGVKDLADSIAAMQDRLDARQATLKQQFTAMETALSQLRSMQSSLGGFSSSSSR
jgi:flagellar hook-associated protein 2